MPLRNTCSYNNEFPDYLLVNLLNISALLSVECFDLLKLL